MHQNESEYNLVSSLLVFWVVTPCGLVHRYQHFGETYCLHLQGWNICIYLQVHMVVTPEDQHQHLHCYKNLIIQFDSRMKVPCLSLTKGIWVQCPFYTKIQVLSWNVNYVCIHLICWNSKIKYVQLKFIIIDKQNKKFMLQVTLHLSINYRMWIINTHDFLLTYLYSKKGPDLYTRAYS
jgi:hypothetical protein